MYINRLSDGMPCGGSSGGVPVQSVSASELMWDWASRPNVPTKEEWAAAAVRSQKSSSKSSSNSSASSSRDGDGKKPRFSKRVMYTLFLTNLLSLLIGAGIG